jgi:hypothetical protein
VRPTSCRAPRSDPWAERDGDRVGELVDAGLQAAPRFLTELQQLRSQRGPPLLASDGEHVAGGQDEVLIAVDLDLVPPYFE